MSREICMVVRESSYGVPESPVVLGTNAFYARLHESDSFTGQMDPVIVTIPYGGGFVTPGLVASDQYVVNFRFRTLLYAGNYSAMLLKWCMTPISADRTIPWTTTDPITVQPIGDLASISIYHAYQRNDGTYDRRRYGGCKVGTWNLAFSRAATMGTLTITGNAIRDDLNAAGNVAYPDASEFPFPTGSTGYPTNPYLFSHTGGNLSIGSTRSQYNSMTLNGANALDARYFESTHMVFARYCGRTTTMNLDMHLKASPDDLALWQAKTPQTAVLGVNNGTHSFQIQYNANNIYTGLGRSLPINQVYSRQITLTNFWDTSVENDLTLTTT